MAHELVDRRLRVLGASREGDVEAWRGKRGVSYLYLAGRLLVIAPRARDLLARLEELRVGAEPLDADLDGLVAMAVDADVPELLDRLDADGHRKRFGHDVSPWHVGCLAAFQLPGPAEWPTPAPAARAPAWDPAPPNNPQCRVAVLDTGLLRGAEAEYPWLRGVTGEPDKAGVVGGQHTGTYGHGTFVAGVVRTVAGLSASVDVHRAFIEGVADEVALARQIAAISADGAHVILVPGGFYTRDGAVPLTLRVLEQLLGEDNASAVIVAAAGNDGSRTPFWPAALERAVSVGALDRDGRRPTAWSNYGPAVDVWAVGDDVVNAFGTGEYISPDDGSVSRFASPARMSGTSVAAAVVAGQVAGESASRGVSAAAALRALLSAAERLPGLGLKVGPSEGSHALGPVLESTLGIEPQQSPELAVENGVTTATAYPLVEAPEDTLVGTEFRVTLGLSPVEVPGVAGGALRLPDEESLDLDVHLVADGFRLRTGESWRNTLRITPLQLYPQLDLHLTAEPIDKDVRAALLQVSYAVGGSTVGWAVRSIAVVRDTIRLGNSGVIPLSSETVVAVADPALRADLTVNIALSDLRGQLLWTFESPHVGCPDEPHIVPIGADAVDFGRRLIGGLRSQDVENRAAYLHGVGQAISGLLLDAPEESPLFGLLREVAAVTSPRPPTVLLQSQDPFVPWELAWMDEPLDPALPGYLGCQTTIGRWLLTRRRRPAQPPPTTAAADRLTVVLGTYTGPDWGQLKGAEEEAAELQRAYGATPVEAKMSEVRSCLEQRPAPDVLHFAVHGQLDPNGITDGLVMADGRALSPDVIVGTPLNGAPFIFLNACEIGAAHPSWGSYAGVAQAFLLSGACGVVAPLWGVKDTVAKTMVLEFYRRAFGGEHPAELIRQLRCGFADSPVVTGTVDITPLAYQFFGHPGMALVRNDSSAGFPA